MTIDKRVEKLADELGCEYVKYLGEKGDYEVYNPYNDPPTYNGQPIFILKKGDEVRYSEPEEWPDIMDRFY